MYLDNTFPSLTPPLVRPLVSALRRPLTSSVWTPAQLFSNGQQGVWYEPRPQYLYQDAAGTTPVTTDGDPVGLMLDRSQGLELGPELVVGGDFSNGIPEVISPHSDSSIEVENGRLKITQEGSYGSIYIKKDVLSAGVYLVEFDYETKGGLYSVRCPDQGEYYNVSLPANTAGHFSGIIINPTDNQEIYVRGFSLTEPWFVDNISVRELPGNHATQSTSAARPTYRTDGTLHWLEFDGVDDVLDNDMVLTTPVISGVAIYDFNQGSSSGLSAYQGQGYLSTTEGWGLGRGGQGFSAQVRVENDGYTSAVQFDSNTATVLTGVFLLDAVYLRRDSVQADVISHPLGSVTPNVKFALGARYGGTSADVFTKMYYYGGVAVGSSTAEQQLQSIDRYLANLAEVTL